MPIKRAAPIGIEIRCPVGGASASPRAVWVDLDWDPGVVSFTESGGDNSGPFLFTLAKGEVETFLVIAQATVAAVSWVAELLLVVDGRRVTQRLDDNGAPFRTSGSQDLPAYYWDGSVWSVATADD